MKSWAVKLLSVSMLMATSLSSNAQEADFISKRQELIKKNQNTKPLVVGFYNSNNKNLDVNLMWNKLAPYSNYLSDQLGSLVVMDVDNSYYNLNKDILANTDILYSTPLLYTQLKELGWHPIARTNQQIKPVVIVLNNSSIKNLNGLKDKTIMVEGGSTMSAYLKVELFEKKIMAITEAKDKYIENNTTTDALLNYLNNGETEAIAIGDNVARRLIAETKNKYRAIATDSSAPGSIVYVNPRISAEQAEKIKNLFLNMKLNDETVRFVLNAAGELVTSQVNQFVEINDTELMQASQIFRQSKVSDIRLN
jgi:ABC-type phosphate/phosphonate transport system substrate-binding protein